MATLSFYSTGTLFPISNLSNSGLIFNGTSQGASVAVGSYNDTTWIGSADGTSFAQQINNVKYINSASGACNSATSGLHLLKIPNYLSTLEIRFNHSSAVKTQNWICRAYDRNNINSPMSGTTVQACQIIHSNTAQDLTGSGGTTWTQIYGSGSVLNIASSPCVSSLYPGGVNGTSVEHSVYLALSLSPDSIGSKLGSLYTSLEYL
jgi:hypothetical protein